MAATGIYYEGRFIRTPGSFSRIDASALAAIGLGASGIVAVIGTGEGGRPVSDITEVKDIIRLNTPEKVRDTFRSGDLREAGEMLFDPSRDPDIGAGAQEMVAMKVNPSTQSSLVLANGDGNVMTLESVDYGAFTSQISYEQLAGTVQGYLVNIRFEDVLESEDNIGGDPVFSLRYDEQSSLGWDTMTAEVLSSGVRANGTRAEAGRSTDVTAGLASVLTAISSSVSDTGRIAVYGLVSGTPTRSVVKMTGTTAVTIPGGTFDAGSVYAAELLDAAAVGTVTVRDSAVTTLLTIAIAGRATGGVRAQTMYVANAALTLVLDAAGTPGVWIVGKDSTGATVFTRRLLTGAVAVTTAITNFAEISFIVLGEVLAARTVTISGTAAQSLNTVQDTLTKAADYFNGRQVVTGSGGVPGVDVFGFSFELLTGLTSMDVADLDLTAAAATIDGVALDFYANLFFILDFINSNSTLVTATRAANATGPATNTTSPQFLSGGVEGSAAFSDYQDALDLLKRIRVNSIVVLTPDPAVHAALEAHLRYRAGLGKSEADGFVGFMNDAMTDLADPDEIRSQALALNSRHIRGFAQAFERFDTSGERVEFDPPFMGVIAAGMQAGAPVGTSLTHKISNVLSLRNHSDWNPVEDSEEMIANGLCFLEEVDGVGRRFVRNITTHLSSSNIAFTEASVNQAANFAVFNFRTNMEFAVGKKGYSGTIADSKAVAYNTLGAMVGDPNPILVAFRSLAIELILDVLEVSVEIAPVIPINFVLTTVHLVAVRQAA